MRRGTKFTVKLAAALLIAVCAGAVVVVHSALPDRGYVTDFILNEEATTRNPHAMQDGQGPQEGHNKFIEAATDGGSLDSECGQETLVGQCDDGCEDENPLEPTQCPLQFPARNSTRGFFATDPFDARTADGREAAREEALRRMDEQGLLVAERRVADLGGGRERHEGYSSHGVMLWSKEFLNGELHGVSRSYCHRSGLMIREQPFRRGLAHGLWRQWHSNGSRGEEGFMRYGAPVGVWTWWDSSGQLIETKDYGHLDTLWLPGMD